MRVRTMADAGALVRGAREDVGWTQAALAARARVSREWLVAFENGKPNANLRLARPGPGITERVPADYLGTLGVLRSPTSDAHRRRAPRRRPLGGRRQE